MAGSWDPTLSGFCYMMLRITGQETIAFSVTIAVNRWFIKQRARAASSLSLAIGTQMQITAGVSRAMELIGWRQTLVLAGFITLTVTLMALPLFCDTPEEVGLGPDGAKSPPLPLPSTTPDAEQRSNGAAEGSRGYTQGLTEREDNSTHRQAIRTTQLRYLVLMGLTFGFSWGGINVHLWAICREKLLPSSAPSMIYVFVGTSAKNMDGCWRVRSEGGSDESGREGVREESNKLACGDADVSPLPPLPPPTPRHELGPACAHGSRRFP